MCNIQKVMEEEVIPPQKGGKYTKRATTIMSKECSAPVTGHQKFECGT